MYRQNKIKAVVAIAVALAFMVPGVAAVTNDENTTPVIEIGDITGGLFKVSTMIQNNGSVNATNVSWNINLAGGFILLGRETNGTIANLPAGGNETISSNFIFGFGITAVTVTAECAESSDTKEQDAFVFLFFIKILDE